MSDTTDDATVKVPSWARNYLKIDEVMKRCEEAPKPQNSAICFCRYCAKGFKSSKALNGHLWIHSQNHGKYSKPGLIHRMIKTPKLEREHSPKEDEDKEDDGFGCFACKESFSSMKLLVQHMAIHRDRDSDAIHRPTMSQESTSLSEAVKQETKSTVSDHHNKDLVKDLNVNRSQTGKRGLKRTAGNDYIIYDAVPLRVYYGPQMQTKKKTGETRFMAYQDTSMEGAAESESTVELNKIVRRHNCNKSKSRRSMEKRNKVHRCEICGKTFEKGQALGGHKTKHRVKDASKLKLLPENTHLSAQADQNHPKAKRMLDFDLEHRVEGLLKPKYVTRNLLPGLLPEEAHLSEEADQNYPKTKKILDFDLNIPYQE